MNEAPMDGSFAPVSLMITMLLHQETSSSPLLDMVDQLPLDGTIDTLRREKLITIDSFKSLISYVKLSRSLLRICHDHLGHEIDTSTAIKVMQEQVADDSAEQYIDPPADEFESVANSTPLPVKDQKQSSDSNPAVSLEEAFKALDVAIESEEQQEHHGQAIIELMQRLPDQPSFLAAGCSALKTRLKRLLKPRSDPVTKKGITRWSFERGLVTVLSVMRKFKDDGKLQRVGLLTLSTYIKLGQEVVRLDQNPNQNQNRAMVTLTKCGGIDTVVSSIVALPDDIEAQLSALGILAHPESTFNQDQVLPCQRLVLSSMARFELNERLQGLASLALCHVLQHHSQEIKPHETMLRRISTNMTRFPDNPAIQSTSCLAFHICGEMNDEIKDAVLNVGAVPLCEKARRAFPGHRGVEFHATLALETLWSLDESNPAPAPAPNQSDNPIDHSCHVQ